MGHPGLTLQVGGFGERGRTRCPGCTSATPGAAAQCEAELAPKAAWEGAAGCPEVGAQTCSHSRFPCAPEGEGREGWVPLFSPLLELQSHKAPCVS